MTRLPKFCPACGREDIHDRWPVLFVQKPVVHNGTVVGYVSTYKCLGCQGVVHVPVRGKIG